MSEEFEYKIKIKGTYNGYDLNNVEWFLTSLIDILPTQTYDASSFLPIISENRESILPKYNNSYGGYFTFNATGTVGQNGTVSTVSEIGVYYRVNNLEIALVEDGTIIIPYQNNTLTFSVAKITDENTPPQNTINIPSITTETLSDMLNGENLTDNQKHCVFIIYNHTSNRTNLDFLNKLNPELLDHYTFHKCITTDYSVISPLIPKESYDEIVDFKCAYSPTLIIFEKRDDKIFNKTYMLVNERFNVNRRLAELAERAEFPWDNVVRNDEEEGGKYRVKIEGTYIPFSYTENCDIDITLVFSVDCFLSKTYDYLTFCSILSNTALILEELEGTFFFNGYLYQVSGLPSINSSGLSFTGFIPGMSVATGPRGNLIPVENSNIIVTVTKL